MKHPILVYCRDHDMRLRDFAEGIDYTAAYLSQVTTGVEKCGAEFARRVFRRYGIPIADLILWEPSGLKRRKAASQ